MQSLTDDEARRFCNQEDGTRKVADDSSIYFDSPTEHSFFIRLPLEYRRLALLSQHLIQSIRGGNFEGGLLWLQRWEVGADYLKASGWRIIEDMRRANGDMRSLDLAPAQTFRNDESLDLQVVLMTVFGNGWSGYFVPNGSDFILEFRSSHRLFFYCESEAAATRLHSEFNEYDPEMAAQDSGSE